MSSVYLVLLPTSLFASPHYPRVRGAKNSCGHAWQNPNVVATAFGVPGTPINSRLGSFTPDKIHRLTGTGGCFFLAATAAQSRVLSPLGGVRSGPVRAACCCFGGEAF